jgi:hypothetical protein
VRFRLEAERKGFKKKVLDNLELIPEQPNAVNVKLELGEETLVVNVDASTVPLVDTETASINGVISSNQVQHMPSFGRDILKLTQLAPGVFGDGSQGAGGGGFNLPGTETGGGATGGADGIFKTENGAQVIANGNQTENNGIFIDGISTTSAVWGGTTVITPSEDSVDNVKVISNSYDAENGRFSGAQIQITSKSGTNDFHGSFFFTAHRPGLNAFAPFGPQHAKPLRDENRFNQLGGSIGGPIWKNRIFAFFNYETVRQPNSSSTDNGWYETSGFDGSAPSGSIASKYLTFPGAAVSSTSINPSTCGDAGLNEGVNCKTIPGQGLDIGSPLTSGLGKQDPGWTSAQNPGVGNGFDGIADIANFHTSSATNTSKAQYNGRLDADVTGKDRIAFAIYWVPQSATFLNGPARGYNLFHHDQINEAYSGIWNRTFSPSLLNEARFNAAGWHWNEISSNPQAPAGLPQDNIDAFGNITLKNFGANLGQVFNQWTYTFKDVATKVVKNHTVKAGIEVTRLFYLNNCVPCGVPTYNFFNIWDFLNDAPHVENSNFDPHTGFPSTNRQDDRENIWGIFVQDDYKVRKNLTLNLGLRWSYFGPLYSKQNNMYVAIPGAGSEFLTALAIRKRDAWNAEKNNFGPQIGFAWSPGKYNDKFVVRGGYGLSYNQEEIAVSANVANNPGLTVHPSLVMPTPASANPGILYATSTDLHSFTGFPMNQAAQVNFDSLGRPIPNPLEPAGFNIALFPLNLSTMRVHHYSLDTQYDLGRQFVATVGYQGSISHNTFFHQNPLAVPSTKGFPLDPSINGGDFWALSGRANYNSLLAGLRHQFSHQFMADAEFAWSKSLDNSSRPYTEPYYPYSRDLFYGRSDYNVGKAFKLFGLWQPVLFHGSNRWIEKIAGGWSLSGIFNVHSGFPWSPLVSVQGGSLYCGQCGYTTLFPAAYLGGAGTSSSNDAFKTGSNYPKGAEAYFTFPAYTAFSGNTSGTAVPQSPAFHRNSLTGPGYRDVDASLTKAFGLPNMPVLGENAKVEFRIDAYNLFSNLNFDPTRLSNNIGCQAGPGCVPANPGAPGISNATFGQAQATLSGRVVTMSARFSF